MPNLKNLACHIQWGETNIPFLEYGTCYGDGVVETFIAIADKAQTFNIQLLSKGYVSEGLCVIVFMDGDYQCNRSRVNLSPPRKDLARERTEVKFLLRQKEKPMGDGVYMGRGWRFDHHNIVPELPTGVKESHFDQLGTIEILVLRCKSHDPARLCPSPCSSTAESDIFGEKSAVDLRNSVQYSGGQSKPDNVNVRNNTTSDETEQDNWSALPGMTDGAYDHPPQNPMYHYEPVFTDERHYHDRPHATGYDPYRAGSGYSYTNGVYPAYSARGYHGAGAYTGTPGPPPPEYNRLRPRKHVRFEDGSTPQTEVDGRGREADVNHDHQNNDGPQHHAEHDWSQNSPSKVETQAEYRNMTDHPPNKIDHRASEAQNYFDHDGDERYNDYVHIMSQPIYPPHTPYSQPPLYFPGSMHPTSKFVQPPPRAVPRPYYSSGPAMIPPIAQPHWVRVPAPQPRIQPHSSNQQHHMYGYPGYFPIYIPTQQYSIPSRPHMSGETLSSGPNSDQNHQQTNGPDQEQWDSQGTGNMNSNENSNQNGNSGENDTSWGDSNRANTTTNADDGWNTSNNANNQTDNQDWSNDNNNNNANTNGNQSTSNWENQDSQYQQPQDSWTTNKNTTNDWDHNNNANQENNTTAITGGANNLGNFDSATTNTRSLYGPHGAYYTTKNCVSEEIRPDAEEEPRYDIPQVIAHATGSSMQVQPGRGYLYTKKSYCPIYLDTMEEPYARFVFKYRTSEQLKQELGIELDTQPSGDGEVQALQNMDKNDLINMFLRAKSALGGQIPDPVTQPATATPPGPMPVEPPLQEFLKYKLPPTRNFSNGVNAGAGNGSFTTPENNTTHASFDNDNVGGDNNTWANQEASTNVAW